MVCRSGYGVRARKFFRPSRGLIAEFSIAASAKLFSLATATIILVQSKRLCAGSIEPRRLHRHPPAEPRGAHDGAADGRGAARIGQISQNFSDQLFTAEIPSDVRSGPYADDAVEA